MARSVFIGAAGTAAPVVHFACAPAARRRILEGMAAKQNQELTKRTAAYRNLLQREDLTLKMDRRRTIFALVGWFAALALVGWALAYFG